jgi:large subunit ribosomal protein L18
MVSTQVKQAARWRRHRRVRRKVCGTAARPRLCVYRSQKHIYGMLVDDAAGRTLLTVSTCDKDLRARVGKTWNRSAAREVGKLLAARARERQIAAVAFDRAGYKFHGRVKELAEGAREGGLKF